MTSHQEGPSSSRDYAREAEHTRRRLAENLDELSDRLTPGQVFDEMMTYSRAGAGTFLSTFSNAMRQNPLPSLLIGAGCMMFISEKMGMRPGFGNGGHTRKSVPDEPYAGPSGGSAVSDAARRMSDVADRMTGSAGSSVNAAAASVGSSLSSASGAAQRRAADLAGGIAETARQTAATASDAASSASDALRGMAHGARDAASYGVEQMRNGVQTTAGTVQDSAASMRDSAASMRQAAAGVVRDTAASMRGVAATLGEGITDSADRTRRHAVDTVRQGRETAASFVSEQPLLCAAIGVAIGAALASMLPSTETEDRLMGETSDAVRGAAKDAAQRTGTSALESAKNVASKVADRAQTAAAEEGLSASGLADAMRGKLDEETKRDPQRVLDDPTTGTGPQEGLAGSI